MGVDCGEKVNGQWTVDPRPICCLEGDGAVFLGFLSGIGNNEPGPGVGIVYLLLLLWSFLGVATVSDVFMSAIEVITSQEKEIKSDSDGEIRTLRIKLWNDTVANLTLMALGSSMPEILLSVIELLNNQFFSGELGPSTVVGSAAFNLFVISAVCVMAIPNGELRQIIGTRVYAVTATCSIFAYLWLSIILMVTSADRVDLWEGVLTFAMFPGLVLLAYAIDVGMLFESKREVGGSVLYAIDDGKNISPERLAKIRKEIKEEYMQALPEEAIMKLVIHKIEQQKPKSRAEYRIKATREMVGGKKLETQLGKVNEVTEIGIQPEAEDGPHIGFVAAKYACLECCESIRLLVERSHDKVPCSVAYETKDGTAKSGEDYIAQSGILEFAAGESKKEIEVRIVDDTTFEEDEEFYVELSSVQCEKPLKLNANWKCAVTIIDDDEPGALQFTQDLYSVTEGSNVEAVVVVERKNGSSGQVSCKYKTVDGTAKAGTDYDAQEGELVFKHSETSKMIQVKIIDDELYEKKERFKIVLFDSMVESLEKHIFTKNTQGGIESAECEVEILNDEETAHKVDAIKKNLQLAIDGHRVGASNYADQFTAAIYCNGSPEEAAEAGATDYALHVLNFPWKLFFAFIPPTDFANGWICFCISLLFIGIVTALVGDLANLLGCALGMRSELTAITFVALGTSLPDTFASKSAAQQDPYADASVGNVTGSNSVNVFLGLGLPWTMGAIYWGGTFDNVDMAEVAKYLAGEEHGLTAKQKKWFERPISTGSVDTFYSEYFDPQTASVLYTDGGFMVPAKSLGFSVTLFTVLACATVLVLYARRVKYGGELGGPDGPKKASAVLLTSFWLIYVAMSGVVIYQDKLGVELV